jgi:hypothetical protein
VVPITVDYSWVVVVEVQLGILEKACPSRVSPLMVEVEAVLRKLSLSKNTTIKTYKTNLE